MSYQLLEHVSPLPFFRNIHVDDSTMFVCIYGQDRSPALQKTYGGRYLPGGLVELQRIHEKMSGNSRAIGKSGTSREILHQVQEIEVQVIASSRIIITISASELQQYAVGYRWLLVMAGAAESLVQQIVTVNVLSVSPFVRLRKVD